MIPDAIDGSLRVAVVAHSERQRRYLAEVLEPNGVQVVAEDALRAALPDRVDEIADVLLVDLEEDSEGDLDLDALLDHATLPMLFNDAEANKSLSPKSIAGRAWGRRLAEKLTVLAQQEAAPAASRSSAPKLKLVEHAAPLVAAQAPQSEPEPESEPQLESPQARAPAEQHFDFALEEQTEPESESAEAFTGFDAMFDSLEWTLDDPGSDTDLHAEAALPVDLEQAPAETAPALDFALDDLDFSTPPEASAAQAAEGLAGESTQEQELSNHFEFDSVPTLDEDFSLADAVGSGADSDAQPVAELSLEELPELEFTLDSGETDVSAMKAGNPNTGGDDDEDLGALGGFELDSELNLDDLSSFADEIEAAAVPWLVDEPAAEPVAAPIAESALSSRTAQAGANDVPIWVLGASIGGPQAVKDFIAQLPADIPAAFVVAQHIGTGFVDLLAGQLDRVTALEVRPAQSGMVLQAGQIVVAPVEERLVFSDGVITLQPIQRKSVYSPSIDDVMSEVAKAFGSRANAVVFSGMGSDGVEGARAIVDAGGVVWSQEASTCVISSMADSVRDAGVVSESGAPSELARRLLTLLSGERT